MVTINRYFARTVGEGKKRLEKRGGDRIGGADEEDRFLWMVARQRRCGGEDDGRLPATTGRSCTVFDICDAQLGEVRDCTPTRVHSVLRSFFSSPELLSTYRF